MAILPTPTELVEAKLAAAGLTTTTSGPDNQVIHATKDDAPLSADEAFHWLHSVNGQDIRRDGNTMRARTQRGVTVIIPTQVEEQP